MRHLYAIAALALSTCSGPAFAQSVSGCGTVAISKASASSADRLSTEADCFEKVETIASGAADARRARLAVIAPPAPPTPEPTTYWLDCAAEGGTCTLPVVRPTQVRFGAAGEYAYREVTNTIACAISPFGGDPAPNVAKTCAYASPTATPPVPVISKPTAARDRLGVNVAPVSYYGGEPVFANQAMGSPWLENWQGVSADRLRPDGMPLSVEPGHTLTLILVPPVTAFTKGDTTTRCTWNGTGTLGTGGYADVVNTGAHQMTFKWRPQDKPYAWLELRSSSAADPVRDLDCRQPADGNALFAPQLLQYLKPFGVLRFLDQSSANGNPSAVTWATRGKPGGVAINGSDGTALEYQIGLANAVGSSPWFTVPWNADADYHRHMAQMVHDSIPAGRPVYVEVSNEVWNYQFGQAGQAQKEGLERKLSTDGFGANLARTAQKITEVMPIWADVFRDRPADLVRVMATQAANAWVGAQILEWNGGAILPHIDAVAIAPYFQVDPVSLTGDQAANMALVAAEARKQIAVSSAAYKAMVYRYGKRLIAYEGGQHQIDVDNVERLTAINRDPAMEAIYRQYLADWQALTSDLFTLYSATGPISKFGAWGLREYAGQPLSETPKLRGVVGR